MEQFDLFSHLMPAWDLASGTMILFGSMAGRKYDLRLTILVCGGSTFKPQASHLKNKLLSAKCYNGV